MAGIFSVIQRKLLKLTERFQDATLSGLICMNSKFLSACSAFFLLGATLVAQPGAETPTYTTGFNTTIRIGRELRAALAPPLRARIHTHPVALETDVRPFVKTVEYPDDNEPLRLVFISVGFIDLMNNIAHAKAIDRIEPGYFQKYLVSLADETGEFSLKNLPGTSDKRFWREDILNDQQSSFNQMVGTVVAIELSHHYLGQYKIYSDRLAESDNIEPINNLLKPSEWEESLKAGVQNALDCGYGIDGLKMFYDAIEKMPKRPDWVDYFLPEHVKVTKVKKNVQKVEDRFFAQ